MMAPAPAACGHGHQSLRAGDDGRRAAHPRPRRGPTPRPGRAGPSRPTTAPRAPGGRPDRPPRVAARPAPAAPREAPVIRPATPGDNDAIAAIWNHEVLWTTATTDTEPRTADAQRAWLAAHGPLHPVIVATEGEEVVAFGALSPYRTKPSYAATVENSVYVKDGWRGKGLGALVLDRLLVLAQIGRAHVC